MTRAMPRAMPLKRKLQLALAAALSLLLLADQLWPPPLPGQSAAGAQLVVARDGTPLRAFPDREHIWRHPVGVEDVSPRYIEALVAYEDRSFWWHPGVNPAALIRSAKATFSGERRQGGSTISMQLARKIYDIDSRSIAGKLQQIAAAFWLEARYSKRDILEAYLNFAPYGGNIEGVGAASLVYFQKRAADLTLPEALTLAVIPQNPAARGGARAGSPALNEARSRMAAIWLDRHPQDEPIGARHAPATVSYTHLTLPTSDLV